ncbi:hypothetical protein CNMCM5623_003530 [Aspergillus felis]|uniref:Uncharacterized protein n=1 Tax=Aspergillus felis TaxID=1287682 RepID=A0A8H6QEA0_9EURO|nr:hypothetical protein CNMCM5623_003530 [Aspergillus felis]
MADSKQTSDSSQLPPAYSTTASSTPVSTSPRSLTLTPSQNLQQPPLFTSINFSRYQIPGATLTDDHVASVTRREEFSRDPGALLQLMQEQVQLPPKLLVQIRGRHSEYGETKNDFDITLNLLPLLVSEDERWSYVKLDPSRITIHNQPVAPRLPYDAASADLETLTRLYCEDPAPLKCFTLKRRVVNFDQEKLDGLIRTAVASTRYQGVVEVSFPLTFAEVVVRHGAEPKASFKDLFFWSMEPPPKKDPTKRYECIEVIWPFANVPSNETGRRCAVQDEQDWWTSWKDVVRNAVLARRTGYVTLEDRMDVAMGVIAPEPDKNWGVSK